VHVPIDNGDRLSFIKINKLIKRQDWMFLYNGYKDSFLRSPTPGEIKTYFK
jgi:hypothetical protein